MFKHWIDNILHQLASPNGRVLGLGDPREHHKLGYQLKQMPEPHPNRDVGRATCKREGPNPTLKGRVIISLQQKGPNLDGGRLSKPRNIYAKNHLCQELSKPRAIQTKNHPNQKPSKPRTIQTKSHPKQDPFKLRAIQSKIHPNHLTHLATPRKTPSPLASTPKPHDPPPTRPLGSRPRRVGAPSGAAPLGNCSDLPSKGRSSVDFPFFVFATRSVQLSAR